MTPDELKAARLALGCTAKELAGALGLDQATVLAWEALERFPTKQYVDKIAGLVAKGPTSIPRKARGPEPLKVLTDPKLWELMRKLLAHKKLRDDVLRLAASYTDPASDDG
jgi:transcriptional regulator with XRE-family HTH domain